MIRKSDLWFKEVYLGLKAIQHFMAEVNSEMVEQLPEIDSDEIDAVSFIETFELNTENDSVEHRNNVVRAILERLPSLSDHDLGKVATLVDQLGDQVEPDVRIDLLEKLPELVEFFAAQDEPEKIETVVVPILLNALKDSNENVRKKAAEGFFSMVEYNALTYDSYVITELSAIATQGDSEEIRLEALTILGRLLSYVRPSDVKGQLYDTIISLSKSPLFQIKQAAILLFGELSKLVGPGQTKRDMVPIVVKALQTDKQHYLVKTAIIEFISQYSKDCSKETRWKVLTPLFVSLLQDPYHRVRNFGYHHLGPFIHSFLDLRKVEDEDVRFLGHSIYDKEDDEDDDEDSNSEDLILDYCNNNHIDSPKGEAETVPTPDSFNSFQFWKAPLPEIQVDLEESKSSILQNSHQFSHCAIENSEDTNFNLTLETKGTGDYINTDCDLNQAHEASQDIPIEYYYGGEQYEERQFLGSYSSKPSSSRASTPNHDFDVHSQDIVPPELLSYYIHMLDAKVLMFNNDGDLPYHCAYSFPAIALTLGSNHWPLLRDLYTNLTQFSIIKIRSLVAYSFHEVVRTVGFAHATRDLAPIFRQLLGDEDDVRSGLVNNLTRIFEMLKDPEAAAKDITQILEQKLHLSGIHCLSNRQHLSLLPDLFKLLNLDKNWRLRLDLIVELVQLTMSYGPYEVMYFIFPLMVALLRDKVYEVRRESIKLVWKLYHRFSGYVDLRRELLHFLINNLALSDQWRERQLFVYLCEELIKSKFLFDEDHKLLAENLLQLHMDSTVSVRIVLARVLASEDIQLKLSNNNKDQLNSALDSLKQDFSMDVRFYLTSCSSSS